ncbi:MAG: cell division protein FtsA, partial [Elusimicrobiota bacterium]|nr:cell division protein FtsA [Elusimicrobiota bacterium]
VIDIQEAASALGRAFKTAEKVAGGQIDSVIAAVRGNFIEGINSKGVANIPSKEVSESIRDEALYSAREGIKLDNGKEVLQIIAREYFLDSQRVQNPLQMEGNMLEIDALGFVANTMNLNNILKAMDIAEINCSNKIYGYMAVCDILLRKEEKESGCLLVDFGGYTTGIVQYDDGILKYAYELPVGSEYITKDLMHKLRASSQEAASIKINHGAAFCADEFQDREFEYRAADGVTMMKADRREIVEQVITPRIEQIFAFIDEVVKKKASRSMPGNIILTGGGSRLEYIAGAFEKYFDEARPFVRIGFPIEDKVAGPREIVGNSVYSCAIGAVYCALSDFYYSSDSSTGKVGKFTNWLKEIF